MPHFGYAKMWLLQNFWLKMLFILYQDESHVSKRDTNIDLLPGSLSAFGGIYAIFLQFSVHCGPSYTKGLGGSLYITLEVLQGINNS